MERIQAAKKAVGFVAKELRGKAFWVWEKRTLFLPSARILREKWWGMSLVVSVLGIGLTFFALQAHPASADWVPDFLWRAFAGILEIISGFFGQLLLWEIDMLVQVSKYNNFLDASVVQIGWVLVRDVANMFFILIMLVIAFGTMLKIEAYSWKKLLPRLILTALLVNFSKTFIGLLIDFSQVIMLTFVNGYAAAAGGNFMNMFKIADLLSLDTNSTLPGAGDVAFIGAMGYLLATVLLGISLIVVGVFLLILVFRIIILWILIVLSPLAFLLGTFPKGQEYYGQWWKQLQGQIIVGPMVAFFLWLSLAALGSGNNYSEISYDPSQGNLGTELPKSVVTETKVGSWENLSSFVVSIAMLLMSLQMISQLGVAGAGLASGALSTIKSKATGIAKKLAVPVALGVATGGVGTGLMAWGGLGVGKWGAKEAGKGAWSFTKRELNERLPAWANVPARFQAWQKRSTEKEEHAKNVAMARQKEKYYKDKHNISLPYEEQVEEAKANEMHKMFADLTQEEQTAMAQKLYHAGNDREARRMRQAIYRIKQKSGYIDDASAAMPEVLSDKAKKASRGALAEREWSLKFLLGDDFDKLDKKAKKQREKERQPELRLVAGKQGFDSTHPEYSYIADADKENPGELEVQSYEEQVAKTGTEVRKGGSERPKVTSPHYMFDIDGDGNVIGFRDNDPQFFKDVNQDIAENDLGRNAPQKRILEAIRSGKIGADMKDGFYEFNEEHLGLIKQMAAVNPFLVNKAFSTPGLKGVKVGGKAYKNIAEATGNKDLIELESKKEAQLKGPKDKNPTEGQEEIPEIPERPDMEQKLPDALVRDRIVSGDKAVANPAAMNQLVGHFEREAEKAGVDVDFSELVEALRRNETALRSFAAQINKGGDKKKEDKIVADLKMQIGAGGTEMTQLIRQLWLNTQAIKQKEIEKRKKENEKNKQTPSTGTPPASPPPPPPQSQP